MRLSIVFAILTSFAVAQAKEDGRAAYDKLLAAHDPDILDAVKGNYLVCFADKNPAWLASDRFLVVETPEINDTTWVNSTPDQTIYGNQPTLAKQTAMAAVYAWEHEDDQLWVSSFLTGEWTALGHYAMQGGKAKWINRPYSKPVYRYSKDSKTDDEKTHPVESLSMDDTTFSASETYKNQASGTTEWSLSIRLSTGRYHETWETNDRQESLGRCYRAKTLAPTTGQKK